MKNKEYWSNRFVQLEKSQLAKGQSLTGQIEKHYSQALNKIEDDISGWYGRFATNNQISMTEARALLTKRELKEFQWSVEDYINYGQKNALDPKWLKELENASARVHISRLESLKMQIQQRTEVLNGNQLDDLDGLMRDIYSDGYYHTAYEIQKGFNVGWDLQKINTKQLDKVISKPWTVDKRTFSDRVWLNKDQLVDSVHRELTQGILTGRPPKDAIAAIAEEFRVSRNKAGRLVMTESAFFASAAQQQAFSDLDVELYEIVATLDMNTSEICQELDGKVFDMKDYEVGVSAPPFHPWCRSVTAPYFEDDDDSLRAARGADGQTYYVDGKMKYTDWKKSFVDGGSKAGLTKVTVSTPDVLELQELLKEKRSLFKTDRTNLSNVQREMPKVERDLNMTNYDIDELNDKFERYEKAKLVTQDMLDDVNESIRKNSDAFNGELFNKPPRNTPERELWDQKYGHMSFDEITEEQNKLYREQNKLLDERNAINSQLAFKDSFDYEAQQKKLEALKKKQIDLNDKLPELKKTETELALELENKKAEMADIIAEIDKIDDGERLRPKEVAFGVKREDPMSIDEANHGKPNPEFNQGGGYTVNCQSCVVTYEARLRGYDVKTLPNKKGSKLEELSMSTNKAWIDPLTGEFPEFIFDDTITTPKGYLKFMESVIEKDKRYTIRFNWKGRSRSGHIISLSRDENGLLKLYDPQVGRNYSGDKVLAYLKQMKFQTSFGGTKINMPPQIMRVDDKEFNLDMINYIMKGVD